MPDPLDIPSIVKTFDSILQRYATWSEPQSKYTAENLPRVNRDGYTWDQFEKGLKELGARMRQEYDPYAEIHAVMDGLCPSYLAATPEERAQVRILVSERRDLSMLIRGYADKMAAKIDSLQDSQELLYGLVAISIEDCRTDYRDTLTSLADLFVRAEVVGIDPMPYFRAVAELSSSEVPQGGDTPVADILRKFDTYAVVAARRRMGKPYRDM